MAVADEVDGVDAMVLTEVGEVFAPVVAVGSETVDEEEWRAVSTGGLVADMEALPGPAMGGGGGLSHGWGRAIGRD